MWSLPEPLIIPRRSWFSRSVPRSRKHTRPIWKTNWWHQDSCCFGYVCNEIFKYLKFWKTSFGFYLNFIDDLKSWIFLDKGFKGFCKLAVISYVWLKSLNPIFPYNKPQFEGSESATQRYAPMPVVNGFIWICMLQIQGVHNQGRRESYPVSDPICWTIKVNKQPFVGVCVEWVCILYSCHKMFVFWTDKGISSICSIYVQPYSWKTTTCWSNLGEIIKGAARCGSKCCWDKEWDQTLSHIIFHCLLKIKIMIMFIQAFWWYTTVTVAAFA